MTLIEAIQANNEKVFFELLSLRVNPLGKKIIDEVDAECGGNALYWAAACGHLHFVEPLIKAGVDLNKADNRGWTPIYVAAYHGHAEIITALKASGADVDRPDDSGTTPVCAAVYAGGAKAIAALKTAGANVNTPEINGLTPLYIAVQQGDLKVIRTLLETKANVAVKTPHGTALDLARGSTTLKNKDIVVKLLEAHQTTLGFKEAEALTQLKEGYCTPEYSTISGIFGRPLTLERQYINLQILCTDLKTKKPEANQESKESAEAKPIEKYKDARMASVEDLFGDKRVIKAEDLFKPTRELLNNQVLEAKNSNEIPRLLLVQGRAGIGKTTFVRYAAHQWSRGQLYTNYTWVFTLTLRKLRLLPKTPELSLSEWIRLSQFSDWSTKEFDELWQQSIEGAIHQNQVLLILDGYDETPEEHPCQSILEQLLSGSGRYAKLNFLITTRPVSAEKISQKRRNLEIIGFTDANINEYIQSYFESSEETLVNTFTEALRKQPIIWANAHIPLNLNLLCGIMEEAIQKAQTEGLNQALADLSSMTRLYQVMERKLYERSYTRREAVLPNTVRLHIRAATNFTQYYEKERLFLAKLAFESFKSGRIIISLQTIGTALAAYFDKEAQNQQQKENLGEAFFKTVCELGLIKPVLDKSGLSETKQDYEFLHLTFQEYYTAIYLVFQLSSKKPAAQTFASSILSKEKYNPRWQIVWWFVAGLLRENKRVYQAYLQQLQGESTTQKDIFEHYPLGLLTRCIDEGFELQNQAAIEPVVTQLQSGFLSLYEAAKSLTNNGYALSKLPLINSPFFSACQISPNLCMSRSQDLYALIPEPKQPKDKCFLSAWTGAIRVITPKVVDVLLGMLLDEEGDVRRSAAEALGNLSDAAATPKVVDALLGMLLDEEGDVRRSAAEALGKLSDAAATPKVVDVLLERLSNRKSSVRNSAVEALGYLNNAAATPKVVDALLARLSDRSSHVRRSAAEALGKLGETAAISKTKVVKALLGLLSDEENYVHCYAARALGELGEAAATPTVLSTLLRRLSDEDLFVHDYVVEALAKLGKVTTPEVLDGLLGMFLDEDGDVRRSAAEALGYFAKVATPNVLDALLGLLSDKVRIVRCFAIEALGYLAQVAATPGVAVDRLLRLLSDEHEDLDVRHSAALALGNLGKVAMPRVEEALLLLSKNKWMRHSAVLALGRLGEAVTPKVVDVLEGLSLDEDSNVRGAAAWALGKLGKLATAKVVDTLVRGLLDEDGYVRRSAAEALGTLGEAAATLKVVNALLGLLSDKNSDVSSSATETLNKLSNTLASSVFLDWLLGISSVRNKSNQILNYFEIRIETVFTLIPSFGTEHTNHPNILAFVSYILAAAYLNSHIICQIGFDKEGVTPGHYIQGVAGKSRYCILITEKQAKILEHLSFLVIKQLSKTGILDIADLEKQLQQKGVIMHTESAFEQKGSPPLTQFRQYRRGLRDSEASAEESQRVGACRIC